MKYQFQFASQLQLISLLIILILKGNFFNSQKNFQSISNNVADLIIRFGPFSGCSEKMTFVVFRIYEVSTTLKIIKKCRKFVNVNFYS